MARHYTFVQVAVRCRPLTRKERSSGCHLITRLVEDKVSPEDYIGKHQLKWNRSHMCTSQKASTLQAHGHLIFLLSCLCMFVHRQ